MAEPDPDFAVVHPDGSITFGHRPAAGHLYAPIAESLGLDSPEALIHRTILGQDMWCIEANSPDLPANPPAAAVLRSIDPELALREWRGPIALCKRLSVESGTQPPLPAWLRAMLGHDTATLADVDARLDAQLADLDPIRLSAYLAAAGWHHTGILPGTDDSLHWTHPEIPYSRLWYPLDAQTLPSGGARARAMVDLARYEGRDPAAVRADLAAITLVPAHPPCTSDRGAGGARERELRGDFARHHQLRRSSHPAERAEAERLEQRWLRDDDRELAAIWTDLEATLAAWLARPIQTSALHAVLTTYPYALTAAQVRTHDQVRGLTAATPGTTAATVAIPAPELSAAATAAPAPIAVCGTPTEPPAPAPTRAAMHDTAPAP